MSAAADAYVVESRIVDEHGNGGTARVYVATEERARQIASEHPGRTWQAIGLEAMPEKARLNMLRARAEAATE